MAESVGGWLRSNLAVGPSGCVTSAMPVKASGLKPKAKERMTAAVFERKYGAMVRGKYGDVPTGRRLLAALRDDPSFFLSAHVTEGVVRSWFANFRMPAGAVKVSSAHELDMLYGDVVAVLAEKHPTAYRLGKALRQRDPPVGAGDDVVRQWLIRYGLPAGAEKVSSAHELNKQYGDEVAELAEKHPTARLLGKALRQREPPVVASEGVVRQWLRRYGVDVKSKKAEGSPEMSDE